LPKSAKFSYRRTYNGPEEAVPLGIGEQDVIKKLEWLSY